MNSPARQAPLRSELDVASPAHGASPPAEPARALSRQRWRLLVHLVRLVEPLMAVFGIVWLALVIVDLVGSLSPALATVSQAIWGVFVVDFAAEFAIAPRKALYLKKNWIVAMSLLLPALRVARAIRIVRVARAARSLGGLRLLRAIASINRGMSSLRATMSRRGVGYVSALTMMVTFAGAGAMLAFERNVPNPSGIHDYSTALWWTAMIMTTMGSAYWPETTDGRVLCVLLALYAFTVFGYVTATLASLFLSRDVAASRSDPQRNSYEALRSEIAELRAMLRSR